MISLLFATAVVYTKEPVAPDKYEILTGQGGNGVGFLIFYDKHLRAVTTMHQFEDEDKPPAKLLARNGKAISLNADHVIRQKDIQIQLLLDPKSDVPHLLYHPRFNLKPREVVLLFDSAGKISEARVEFKTMALGYNSIEGAKELLARPVAPLQAVGASGSPVIQKSTGAVVGVFQTADNPTGAKLVGFETLCLPILDIAPRVPLKKLEEFTDPKEREVNRAFRAFTTRIPAAHWKAADEYFKASGLEKYPESLVEFLKKNAVSEVTVRSGWLKQWIGSVKLGDDKLPSEFWTYEFTLRGDHWQLTGAKKHLGKELLDLLGDRLFRIPFERELKAVAHSQ